MNRGAGAGKVQLVLGPWTHGGRSFTYSGDADFGAAATLDNNLAEDFLQLRLRWFDRWLRDVPATRSADLPVKLFVMGGGSGCRTPEGRLDHGGNWRAEVDWPIPRTRWTTYFLQPQGGLSSAGPPQEGGCERYTYDPRNPVPTIGGAVANGEPYMFQGGFDQRESEATFGADPPYRALADRADVLVFRTEPLMQDVEVSGPVKVKLWIASDCLDTDFTVKLIDAYPPNADYPQGYALNVADGIIRARYRQSWERPVLLTAGEVSEVEIETFPTSNRFCAGHRIRLDISSSNYPHFDANPNTGEPEGGATHLKLATNAVHFGGARASCVLLPVIPAG